MKNELTAFHETSDVTFTAAGEITGKTFVAPSGDRESGPGLADTADGSNYVFDTCGAGDAPAGVANYDVATGDKGGITGTPGRIVPVTTDGTVDAGDLVEVGTGGKAKALASGKVAGLCLNGASSGDDAEIKLL